MFPFNTPQLRRCVTPTGLRMMIAVFDVQPPLEWVTKGTATPDDRALGGD
jgi:hypothetical protein